MNCTVKKGHISAKSVKFVSIFYLKGQKSSSVASHRKKTFRCYPELALYQSCLEKPSFTKFPVVKFQ